MKINGHYTVDRKVDTIPVGKFQLYRDTIQSTSTNGIKSVKYHYGIQSLETITECVSNGIAKINKLITLEDKTVCPVAIHKDSYERFMNGDIGLSETICNINCDSYNNHDDYIFILIEGSSDTLYDMNTLQEIQYPVKGHVYRSQYNITEFEKECKKRCEVIDGSVENKGSYLSFLIMPAIGQNRSDVVSTFISSMDEFRIDDEEDYL